MKVLVGCEFSGVVRTAFRKLGHDAYSCDLLPAEDNSEYHYQVTREDELETIAKTESWDLGIFHPPCTYLANSGSRWLWKGRHETYGPDPIRWEQMRKAATFFKRLLELPINKIAVENPLQHEMARKLIDIPYTQKIQPYQFGHGETKATCLWLKNLPKLKTTNFVKERVPRVHYTSPSDTRWMERSRTLTGIAEAMATQWSK